MLIHSFKYRIYPTKRQVKMLNNQLAICCELYNAALQERRDAWALNKVSCGYYSQSAQLVEIKTLRPDVAEVSANVLENALKRLDRAFENFFRRVKANQQPGYPRFKSFRRYDSMTFRQIGNALTGNKLRVSKIGNIRIKITCPLSGPIKTMTIKREGCRWFAVFACEYTPKRMVFNPNTIGLDVGLTHFATLSDGRVIENPRYYREAQAALRVAQRRVSRRKKGSNQRRKAVALLQSAHAMIRKQRADFHHRISRGLVNNFGLIAVEDLNVKGLARGMLAKSVNDAGWSSFIDKLAYKVEWAGRVLVKVDPRGTSQTCTCGTEVRKTLSQRWHLCLGCGLSLPRDHVSAQIILSRAQAGPSGANVEVLNSCVA